MKKGTRILALTLFSLVLVSFLVGVVSAAEELVNVDAVNAAKAGTSDIATSTLVDQVKSLFSGDITSWTDFLDNLFSPQVLFGILIFLIIFAIFSSITLFRDKPGINVAVSIIVSILAAGFINPLWYSGIINQYQSLGIAISFLIPFVLLFYFIKEIIPTQRTFQHLVWGVYFVIVVTNFIINYGTIQNDATAKALYWITGGLSLIMLIFGHTIINMLFKEELKSAMSENIREAEAALTAEIIYDRKRLSGLSGVARTAVENAIKRNESALKKLTVK